MVAAVDVVFDRERHHLGLAGVVGGMPYLRRVISGLAMIKL